MYFNEKGNTNIDSEFKGRRHKRKKWEWSIKNIIIVSVIALIIIGLIIFLLISMFSVNFKLLGDKNMTIYQNSTYIEPGFDAYDDDNINSNSEVTISGDVNTSEIGTYKINYTFKNKTLTRTVKVVEAPEVVTFIHLNGDKIMTVNVGEEFVDPGYSAVDAIDGDLTSNVTINSNVNTAESGTYHIIYSVVNSNGITTTESRTIIVK